MPDLSVSETQLERLESIREDLETAYINEYGTIGMQDTVEYLLDTYTAPGEADDSGNATGSDGADLTAIKGVGEATAESLASAGFNSVGDVAAAAPTTLTEIKGIGDEQAVDIVAAATETAAETSAGETNDGADGASDEAAETTSGDETETTDGDDRDGSADGSSGIGDGASGNAIQQAMSLLDTHDERWRESSGDEPYEVDLPDGSTTGVRTKDDIKRLLFKHWR